MAKAPATKRPYTRRNLLTAAVEEATKSVNKTDLGNPVAMRNRINQINQIAQELHEEKAWLEAAIKDMGFVILDGNNAPKPAKPFEEWQEHNAVRCLKHGGYEITPDRIYLINSKNSHDKEIEVMDDDRDCVSIPAELFEFVA